MTTKQSNLEGGKPPMKLWLSILKAYIQPRYQAKNTRFLLTA